ncbi:Eukaryotic translation initiation factor 3 subunit CLU1 TIF31 protein [Rutstroemia sp. NJR-2017a BBW]|nr:Eukaryotic translation initiation factor 3 subunit CLU1 TIF31 protein [Rutstroemia sp. NJR-2017a BBW]
MSASALESNVAAGSFTPVRRKNFTLSDGRLRRDVEKEWTATRCNRLLRRLTSKIAILQKERARSIARSQSNKRVSRTSLNVDESKKENSYESNWIGSRKKVKRTYSGRSGSIGYGSDHGNNGRQIKKATYSRMSSFPGEIIVPTPLLNRALRKSTISSQAIPFQAWGGDKTSKTNVSEESFGIRSANGASKTFPIGPQALRDVRKTTSSMRCNAYEGIYDHFKNLLEATQSTPHDLPRTGIKSLLSTCLRAIPKYISLEERTMAEEVDEEGPNSALEKRDVSMEVYDDLETFGSLGHGWTQLQSVVRAHGVHIICNAIADGLLDDQFSEKLVELCVQSGNEDEGQSLLSSILSRCKFPAPRKVDEYFLDHSSLHPLSLLWRFAEDTGRSVSEQPSSQIQYKLLRDCFTMIATAQKNSKDHSTIFLLANLVIGPSTDQVPSLSVDLVDRNLHSMWEQHKIINFLSSMARCCGRATSNSGFEYLQRIHKALRHWVTSRQSKETSIWYEIMVDSAFTFAQQAPGETFLNYAVSLDSELKARTLDRPTSSSLQDCAGSPGAFRWEEGISAWVTRTPAQAQVRRKNTRTANNSGAGVLESSSPSVMARTQRPTRASLDGLINNRSRSSNSCLDRRIASKHTTKTGKRKAITSLEIWHPDSSNDELNSSFESSQENHVLKNVPNMTQRKRCRLNRTTHHKLHREAKTDDHNAKSFSEDELCI